MDGSMPPGNHEPDDFPMTDAGNEAGGMFDSMLAEIDTDWGNTHSQDPFMFQTENEQDNYINPAHFAEALGLPDIYSASLATSGARQEDQIINPFAITSSPIYPTEPVVVSTPSRQQASSSAPLLNSSPLSATLSTPTHRDRGHYGSARRRSAASNNLQTIAPSLGQEAARADPGYTFEPIPEHQQGIVSPGFFNENTPGFLPRGVQLESQNANYDNYFHALGDQGSSSFAAYLDAFEGAVGGYDSQETEPDTTQAEAEMARIRNALQYLTQFPVLPGVTPTYTNDNAALNAPPSYNPYGVQAGSNGSTDPNAFPTYVPAPIVAPTAVPTAAPIAAPVQANANWSTARNTVAGLNIPGDVDPERRAKMLEIASVAHMLLTRQDTLRGAHKAKLIQAGRAADEDMRQKASANDVRQNAKKTQAPAVPASRNQPEYINQPASTNPTSRARGRQASNTVNPTIEQRVAQFWRGRRDRFGNIFSQSFLCHGSMIQFEPGAGRWSTSAAQTRSNRYSEKLPEEHPRLSEDTPEQEQPHSELMLVSVIMTENNFDRPVHSGQVVVMSYNLKTHWSKRINVWAWNRYPMARCMDEIAIVITPFHIIFGRVPRTTNDAILQSDWRCIVGLIDRTLRIPVFGAEEKTWAFMYRLVPCTIEDQGKTATSYPEASESGMQLMDQLGSDIVYNKRLRQIPYYIPPVGDFVTRYEFCIRVGHFGKAGQHDRPHVEITDLAGRRVIDD
ncbi:hypothetical protein TMatcc_008533 [Talaromyces marneffei ATCC 18224]